MRRNAGTPKCKNERILKPRFNNKGYEMYALCKGASYKNYSVHRLVCKAFNGEQPMDGMDVAHNDGNPLNNSYANLRWATRKENLADRVPHGTDHRGDKSPAAIISDADVIAMRQMPYKRGLHTKLAQKYGVCRSTVSDIINGHKRKFSGGLI